MPRRSESTVGGLPRDSTPAATSRSEPASAAAAWSAASSCTSSGTRNSDTCGSRTIETATRFRASFPTTGTAGKAGRDRRRRHEPVGPTGARPEPGRRADELVPRRTGTRVRRRDLRLRYGTGARPAGRRGSARLRLLRPRRAPGCRRRKIGSTPSTTYARKRSWPTILKRRLAFGRRWPRPCSNDGERRFDLGAKWGGPRGRKRKAGI
jgi:hypothetical protein